MAARKPKPIAQAVPVPVAGIESGDDRVPRQLDYPERGDATADAVPPARVSVSVNTLITRTDLGPGRSTFVAAGDLIPTGLEAFPRAPA